jgi:hypothetical protein
VTSVGVTVSHLALSPTSSLAFGSGPPDVTNLFLLNRFAQAGVDPDTVVTLSPASGSWTMAEVSDRIRPLLSHHYDPVGHAVVLAGHSLRPSAQEHVLRVVEAPPAPWHVWVLHDADWTPIPTLRSRASLMFACPPPEGTYRQVRSLCFSDWHAQRARALLGGLSAPDTTANVHAGAALADPRHYAYTSSDSHSDILLRASTHLAGGEKSWASLSPAGKQVAKSLLRSACSVMARDCAVDSLVAATSHECVELAHASHAWTHASVDIMLNIPVRSALRAAVSKTPAELTD